MRGSLIVRSFLAALALLLACAGSAGAGPKDHFKGRHVGGGAAVAAWCSDPAIVSPPSPGTSLAATCALTAEGATGPRYAFDAAHTWVNAATSLGAGTYLGDLGCVQSFYNSITIWCDVTPGGSITIEKYDFGPASIGFNGNGITATIRDSRFTGGGAAANQDRNGAAKNDQQVTFNLEYDEFNGGLASGMIALFSGGTINQSFNRIKNQVQVIWYIDDGYTQAQHINITDNYITGGGVNTPCCTHLEVLQFQEPHLTGGSGSTLNFSRNVVNPIDGQPGGGASWTAYIVANDTAITFTSNIFHNWDVVAANPTFPGLTGPPLSYSLSAVFTNNALQPGSPGSGGGYVCSACAPPTDGGGNRRTDTNAALNF